jgi:aminoglycoside 6'-N-acetyltransferase
MAKKSWQGDYNRAIRCYEKAGFTNIKLLPKHESHEGEYKDCWLMEFQKVFD